MRTAAILPVKRFSSAKQRLGRSVADHLRAELARAMVGDVLSALRDCAAIDATIVVTSERTVAAAASYIDAIVVEDTAESGQSAAASIGLQRAIADGFERALCVPGDCPALDPSELAELLRRNAHAQVPAGDAVGQALAGDAVGQRPAGDAVAQAPSWNASVVIVPDRHGSGTNGLLLTPPDAIQPSFGPGSRVRHERLAAAAGVGWRVEEVPSLLLDVDTGEDLAALRERLAGEPARAARTRAVLVGWPLAAQAA